MEYKSLSQMLSESLTNTSTTALNESASDDLKRLKDIQKLNSSISKVFNSAINSFMSAELMRDAKFTNIADFVTKTETYLKNVDTKVVLAFMDNVRIFYNINPNVDHNIREAINKIPNAIHYAILEVLAILNQAKEIPGVIDKINKDFGTSININKCEFSVNSGNTVNFYVYIDEKDGNILKPKLDMHTKIGGNETEIYVRGRCSIVFASEIH